MRLRFQIIMLLITAFMSCIPVSAAEESDMKIIGRLIKVDAAGGIIYVVHDSRIVKFRASKEICHKFKESIQSFVEIGYSKCSEKGFCVVTIEVRPDETYKSAVPSELKSVIFFNR